MVSGFLRLIHDGCSVNPQLRPVRGRGAILLRRAIFRPKRCCGGVRLQSQIIRRVYVRCKIRLVSLAKSFGREVLEIGTVDVKIDHRELELTHADKACMPPKRLQAVDVKRISETVVQILPKEPLPPGQICFRRASYDRRLRLWR